MRISAAQLQVWSKISHILTFFHEYLCRYILLEHGAMECYIPAWLPGTDAISVQWSQAEAIHVIRDC